MTSRSQPAAEIIIVRHGRTDANSSGMLQGRVDNELNDEGREQAARVGAYLASSLSVVPEIVVSPLLRARQTAEFVVSAFGGQPALDVDERWIELDYGMYDGRPLSSVPGEVWRRWRADDDFAPEGGESLAAVHRRVTEACEALAHRALAGRSPIVVVSHVSPIKSAVAWALGVSPAVSWRTHLDNASVTRLVMGSNGPSLAGFNLTAHLGTQVAQFK